MKITNKKYTIFIAIVLIILVLFILNLFKSNKPATVDSKIIVSNEKLLKSISQPSVEDIELQIATLDQESGGKGMSKSESQAIKYQRAFSNSVIIGDSVTHGISAYGYLTEEQVISKIGASLLNSEDLFEVATNAKSKNVFLAFGINDLGNFGTPQAFIDTYVSYINSLKKNLPKANIYVNAILPASDDAISNKPVLKKRAEFNAAIEKMCKKEKVTFIDAGELLSKNPDLYEGDGIHTKAAFYPIWLDFMRKKADL